MSMDVEEDAKESKNLLRKKAGLKARGLPGSDAGLGVLVDYDHQDDHLWSVLLAAL